MIEWRTLPSLAALRAFEATARAGSLTGAAKALNVTHAAIAHHLRGLEGELGRGLVVREGRGIALTAEGRALADALSDGFGTIADGIARLRAEDEARPLSVSLTPAFATNWLMPRIGDFWSRHPGIALNIAPSLDLVDLGRDGVDVAIRFGVAPWPPYDARLLTDDAFWVVARPDLLEGREAGCLADVADLTWLVDRNLREWHDLLAAEGLDIANLTVTRLNMNGLVLSALKEGLGVSLQSRSLVARDVGEGRLTRVCTLRREGLGYHVVTDPRRPSERVRTFARWLTAQARADRETADP